MLLHWMPRWKWSQHKGFGGKKWRERLATGFVNPRAGQSPTKTKLMQCNKLVRTGNPSSTDKTFFALIWTPSHHYVWTSFCQVWQSQLFDFLTSFWQFFLFLIFWHLFDILTHDILLKPPQVVTEVFLNIGTCFFFVHFDHVDHVASIQIWLLPEGIEVEIPGPLVEWKICWY